MHHLGVAIENAPKPVFMLIDGTTVTELTTGAVLCQHFIDSDKNYWSDTLKPPGRWPDP